jgi:hypothetical protein
MNLCVEEAFKVMCEDIPGDNEMTDIKKVMMEMIVLLHLMISILKKN